MNIDLINLAKEIAYFTLEKFGSIDVNWHAVYRQELRAISKHCSSCIMLYDNTQTDIFINNAKIVS
jgi:hypothetical protein